MYFAIELTTRVGTMNVIVKSFVKVQQRRANECTHTMWYSSKSRFSGECQRRTLRCCFWIVIAADNTRRMGNSIEGTYVVMPWETRAHTSNKSNVLLDIFSTHQLCEGSTDDTRIQVWVPTVSSCNNAVKIIAMAGNSTQLIWQSMATMCGTHE